MPFASAEADRLYHRTYMRCVRATQPRRGAWRPNCVKRARVFKPLAADDQREGYCVFCGHELGAVVNDVVCTRCRREIES